jgi:ribonuclease D
MFGDTPLVMIEDDDALRELVEELRECEVVGVDTEADSFHHYQEKLCLVQVSDSKKDYIIDPLKVDDLSPLGELLEDRNVVKVLHGGDYDVVSLKRDHDIHIHNIFDTMIAAQFLGLPRFGLADLIKRYFGHTIDKRYQRHDWASRPLLPEHLDYARGDTHFLLALREVLTHRLRQTRRIAAHSEECTILEDRTWSRNRDPETAFLLMKKAKGLKTEETLKALRTLWEYRDGIARKRDRPAFKVLPEDVLVKLAKARPLDEDALHKLIRPTSSMARRHGKGLLEAVRAAEVDERPIPPRPKGKPNNRRAKSGGASVDRYLGPLKDWRNAVVKRDKLAPVVVASNGLLKEVARVAPDTLQDLSEVPGIRQWQVRHYGADILDVLDGVRTPKPKKRRRRGRKAPAS